MPTRVVALAGDLMDRSKLVAAIAGLEIASDLGALDAVASNETPAIDVVIIDLARHAAAVPEVRGKLPDVWIVAFGPHVDADAATEASASGADVVLPRSRFFRDPAAAIRRPG